MGCIDISEVEASFHRGCGSREGSHCREGRPIGIAAHVRQRDPDCEVGQVRMQSEGFCYVLLSGLCSAS